MVDSSNLVTTVTKQYQWYAESTSTTGTTLSNLLFTDSNLNLATTASYVIKKGLYDKYIWCKVTVSAPGYETQTATACLGKVAKDQVTPNVSWVSDTTAVYGTKATLSVATKVGIQSSEFSTPTYTPSLLSQSGRNYATDYASSDIQSAYDVTVTPSYHWVFCDSTTAAPTESTYTTSSYTLIGTSAEENIPKEAVGKKIYCVVTYTINDTANYVLTRTSDVKAYENAVEGGTLTLIFADNYGTNDTMGDGVAYGIHDQVTISVVGAKDTAGTTYDTDQLKALNLTNWVYTWYAKDSSTSTTKVSKGNGETSSDNLTSTFTLNQSESLVGKVLTVTVSASSEQYTSATGDKANSVSTAISKAQPTLTMNSGVDGTYGVAYQPMTALTTSNFTDSDFSQSDVYFSIDTELTDDNYSKTGTKGTVPSTTTSNNAYNGSSQITHYLYAYVPEDADHNSFVSSTTFKIERASKTITIKQGTTDVTGTTIDAIYGDALTLVYTINETPTNEASSTTVKGSLDNLNNITTSGTTSSVSGNTATTISSKVNAFNETDTVITISSAVSDNYESAESKVTVNTVKRNITVPTATISDTTPYFNDAVTITAPAVVNVVNSDDPIAVTYQWYEASSANGDGTAISGATNASYTPTADEADSGKFIYCVVTYTNSNGNYTVEGNDSTYTQTIRTTAVVAKRTMSIALALSGDAIYGQVLTATSTIEDNTSNTVTTA